MLTRMLGAASLNSATFEDVEHDRSATWQAALVVVLVSIAGFIGGLLSGGHRHCAGAGFRRHQRRNIVGRLGPGACWLIGTTILKTPDTSADWGELARGTGFAQTPGLLNVLLFIPTVGGIIGFVVFLWQMAAMLMAVKASLDYTSLWRAFFVALIAFIPVLIINAIIFVALGFDDTDNSAAASLSAILGIINV